MNILTKALYSACMLLSITATAQNNNPNLLIIHTDEHNFRTLGCYREILNEDQAFMWGKDTYVKTPNIDALAKQGALCTSFYAASPVCTPSRASLISGLYPIATGSHKNDLPLKDDIVTFAEILKNEGYSTSYVGKWHLDGEAKPGFEPARKFGFDDNRYMFNRGHYKILREDENGPHAVDINNDKKKSYSNNINSATEKSFTTDFLTDRTLEILERDKDKPFCLMLSIPDPHGPNKVRAPYDEMYTHMRFEQPHSMTAALKQAPKWNGKIKKQVSKLNQKSMAQYFGMVKCIDDNVGRILKFLKDEGLDKNTIVVFTSDHGDLMGEHARHNKGLPYEASACIPFIIKYPGKVKPGKIIKTAYSTVDFAPTILKMMEVEEELPEFHGQDVSEDFLNAQSHKDNDRIIYITNAASRWVAAVNDRYKLILSPTDSPWLFDLGKDPDELINFFNDPAYKEVADRFVKELTKQMIQFGEPALEAGTLKYE